MREREREREREEREREREREREHAPASVCVYARAIMKAVTRFSKHALTSGVPNPVAFVHFAYYQGDKKKDDGKIAVCVVDR